MSVPAPDKIRKLQERIKSFGSVLVAFSGGVDSSFLLAVCRRVLKENVLAVTAVSRTYTLQETRCAQKIARKFGSRHVFLKTREWQDENFRANPLDRCYYCKKELFARLKSLARREKLAVIIDGSNKDDVSDYRPGARAKREAGVRSPLQEAGLTKKEIRNFSRAWGLATWNKPAMPCLASRIPYGSEITKKRLNRVGGAEDKIRKHFRIQGNLRVRDFWPEARVEADPSSVALLKKSGQKLQKILREAGYKTMSVKRYRMGSLNRLPVKTKP